MKETEVKVYAFFTPDFDPFAKGEKEKRQSKVMDYLKGADGFIGVSPSTIGNHVAVLFDSPETAILAQGKLEEFCFTVSPHVIEGSIDKKFISGNDDFVSTVQ